MPPAAAKNRRRRIGLRNVRVAGRGEGLPLVTIGEISAPFGAVLGWKTAPAVTVSDMTVRAVRGGDHDNVSDIIERLSSRRKPASADGADGVPEAAGSGSTPPGIALLHATLSLHDTASGLAVAIEDVGGVLLPSDHLLFRAKGITGRLALTTSEHGPQFGAREVQLQVALHGMHPDGYPSILVQDGYTTPLPSLALTGISGRVGPQPTGVTGGNPADKLVIDLHGSYGGARETLWTARGGVDPAARQGRLVLRAEQFSLDKVRDI
jgi:hypothetical protein